MQEMDIWEPSIQDIDEWIHANDQFVHFKLMNSMPDHFCETDVVPDVVEIIQNNGMEVILHQGNIVNHCMDSSSKRPEDNLVDFVEEWSQSLKRFH